MSQQEIVNLATDPFPQDQSVEICIIGSGCGGATAAWELAKAGRQVLVLEEGGDRIGFELTQRDAEMYDQLYMDRAGRSTSDMAISVMQGRALGGGGVINASDVVPISDEVLVHWQKRWGLTEFSPEALAPYREQALADLSATVVPEELINANNKILKRGADALGWKGEVMLHNRVRCKGVGTCLIGCPFDRKRNPRFVAIPNALEAGARFFIRARALRIENGAGELKTVHARTLDAKGYREERSFTVRAKVVIVAANAVSSAQLLLRSGLGNTHVGQHLMLQPQQPITTLLDERVDSFRLVPQAYAVTQFEQPATAERGWSGFRIEAIAGTPGIVSSLLPYMGDAGKQMMQRFPHFAASLLLVPDEPSGRVRVEPSGRLRIDYAHGEDHKSRVRAAIKAAARVYFAAGAKEVLVPTLPALRLTSEADLARVDGLKFEPATSPFLSAHQMGTVRFSPNERDGGANPDGQVYGARDVYVFDSSGFPSSASSHTMAPIITVSRFLTRKLLSRLPA